MGRAPAITVTSEGLTEISAALKLLPEAFREVAADSLEAGSAIISAEADSRVPVDEGELRDSGDSAIREDGLQVTVGYADVKARWVEFATEDTPAQPFLYPAFRIGVRFVRKQMRTWAKTVGQKVVTRTRIGSQLRKLRKGAR